MMKRMSYAMESENEVKEEENMYTYRTSISDTKQSIQSATEMNNIFSVQLGFISKIFGLINTIFDQITLQGIYWAGRC